LIPLPRYINMVIFGTYFTFASKRFYKVGGYHAFSGALITTVMFVGILTGYRLLIFYKVNVDDALN
jgi:hypothetical protein